MMPDRSGTTKEGTTWRTRPLTPEIAASYSGWNDGRLNALGSGKKAYSPTAKGPVVRAPLPSSIRDEFVAAVQLARRRLDGLEPWPPEPPAPRPVTRTPTDASVTKSYRELVTVAGKLPCAAEDRHAGKLWPWYAITAVRHLEAGRRWCACDDCNRARKDGYLDTDSD